jgi:hypothetical protein
MAKPATLEAYYAGLSSEERAICDTLRTEIDAQLPEAESKIWHAHPVWFLDGNPITGYSRVKAGISLMFWSGQSFDAPGLTPSGSFKAAVALYADAGQIDLDALRLWLAQSRDIQWDYKNIIKRKGRLERLK